MAAQEHNYLPKEGYVPDERTAIAIAEAVLLPIYGEKQISKERPFHAKLNSKQQVWTVEGSIRIGSVGGVATIRIQRQDARILSVTHGK
jgi:hypothetical protein